MKEISTQKTNLPTNNVLGSYPYQKIGPPMRLPKLLPKYISMQYL
jgi:hypothetical protein